MSDWLSPMNKLKWIKAFRAKAPQLTIDDGRKFTMEYREDKVLVKPVKNLAPMGWFELRKVTDPGWLDTHEKH